MTTDLNDPRWGGYVPWFLRHKDFSGQGEFARFFSRVSQRLDRLLLYNEAGIGNLLHFGDWLESESLQRFRNDGTVAVNRSVSSYFDPETIAQEAKARADQDAIEISVKKLRDRLESDRRYVGRIRETGISLPRQTEPTLATIGALAAELKQAEQERRESRPARQRSHYTQAVIERMGVLEALLRILPPETAWKAGLIRDSRRFFAESNIPLDVKAEENSAPMIVPLEEPLLQRAVIDELLPRLAKRFPERAKEFISAYHNLLAGVSADSVFAEAFKTLEELARDLTGDKNFMFTKSYLDKYYKNLHPTIHNRLIQLAAHRGDRAGHGKDSPFPHEIRYVLFDICNSALLLLDYPNPASD